MPGLPGGLFQPAAEPGSAAANLVLHHLTGSPTMFLELWVWDEPKNLLVGGHLGLQNPVLGQPGKVSIGRFHNYLRPGGGEGVQFQMLARGGRATLFQLRATPAGWQAIAATGVCLESRPWLAGYPHAVLRLDAPVDHFLHQVAAVGSARHWILAYGSVLADLETFCQMSRVPLEIIQ
jgi:hypothetical protein